MKCCFSCCFCCCCCYYCCFCCYCCCCSYCCCWSQKPTFKVWLKSAQEQPRYCWRWVPDGGGGWCKVIFASNPTFELSCGWVWVGTKWVWKHFFYEQLFSVYEIWWLKFCFCVLRINNFKRHSLKILCFEECVSFHKSRAKKCDPI